MRLRAARPQQEIEEVRLRELGRPAESAVGGVEGAPGRGDRMGEDAGVPGLEAAGGGLGLGAAPVQDLGEVRAGLRHLVAPRAVGAGGGGQHLAKRGHAVTGLGREVGAAVVGNVPAGVRNAVRGQPPWPVIACTARM